MAPKYKALLFNFISFTVLFVILRVALGYFLSFHSLVLALIAAVLANVLVPKFWVAPNQGKVLMKWVFSKGIREL
jgi:antibiotic biosynthesis monooxygenase (ABM) superfamily enzyme